MISLEDAIAYCGPDVPDGGMPGSNPFYPVTRGDSYINFKNGNSYVFKGSKTYSNLTLEQLIEKFTSVCGDFDTRMSQGINYVDPNIDQMITNYYAGNTTEKFRASFTDISYHIKMVTGDYVTEIEQATAADISGYVTIMDDIGEYMEVKDIRGIRENGVFYSGASFAQDFRDISWLDRDDVECDNFRRSLYLRTGMPTNKALLRDIFLGSYAAKKLYYNNDSDYNNCITWYCDVNNMFVGAYYDVAGNVLEPPAKAVGVVDTYFIWGDSTGTVEDGANMFYLSVAYGYKLDSLVKRLYLSIPASLMPVRVVDVENGAAYGQARCSSD